jgi:ABC-type phosphate transport system substrate-binding protein
MAGRCVAPLAATLAGVVLAAACGAAGPPAPRPDPAARRAPSRAPLVGQVWTDGSSELTGLVILASERFRNAHSGIEIVVGLSGGGGAVRRLCRGEVDLATLTRPLTAAELLTCAREGVTVVRIGARPGAMLLYAAAPTMRRPEVRAFAEYLAGPAQPRSDRASPPGYQKDT